ncbi:NAD(P)/FAD-dependent oxidoreductase [Nocardia brasiliensis]|uniref:NAD(P)/FAD-dependent oxidoreductase n=1 Tax=Nocardia brasiliensis TaxID=37326 RepID=UPI00068A6CA0|nr:FAD-dependent oxidoreductase [Nocardia brasiliensis]
MTQRQVDGRAKAIVIGGGIAGLLAARVLAEHYTEVLVLDRDAEPGPEIRRRGVPQTFHLHQMLPRGEQILERLLPGFVDDVLRLGAFPLAEATLTWTNRYGTMMMPSPDKGAFYSRGLVEQAIRARVQGIANVRFGYAQQVVDVCATADATRITGVRCRTSGEVGPTVTMSGDLVVDASGRSSKLPQWLSQLGYQAPPDETVTSGIGYSTRYYRVPQDRAAVPALVVVENDYRAGNPAGGVLKRIEGDVWSACLSGIGGQYPPVDAAGFDAGLAELISPAIAEALCGAEPLTSPRGFRIPVCVRRHYEQMARWPAGLLALGDAMSTVDPIYGQGMTVAAIQAEAVAEYLAEEHGPGGELDMLRRLQQASYPAWWLSALEDLRWPGVEHRGGLAFARIPLLHKYFDLALERMTQQFAGDGTAFDPTLLTFFAMTGLIAAPADVVNETMLKALLNGADTDAQQTLRAELAGYGDEIATVLAEAVAFDAQH